MRIHASPLLLAVGSLLVACAPPGPARPGPPVRDPRPIFAEAALPKPGSLVPGVDVERLGGGRVQLEALRGQPILLVLWSTGCVRSREAVAAVDSLHRQYGTRGVRTLLLADDVDSALVRTVLARHGLTVAPPTTPDTGIVVGLTRGALAQFFDRSAEARLDPALSTYRVEFVAPGFLLVDPAGVVRRRGAIMLYRDAFAAAVDSLLVSNRGDR